jgi:hypothetical protein
MGRPKLSLELVPHLRIGQQIIALAREKPRYRDLIILIRFNSELATVMPIRDESLVKLLHSEREGEILGMPVTDVAHQPMKNTI